ncbi:hypothetical protein I553_6996 [Mycobacterium xenopi 4042]|uniref:Uncharacterized protein n=1 Tax=Mycobacterium xenopi 4042 TaxID=1299334 RepID=X7Z4C1_MYCXE|nr:hypothetical protein I553_6996 [Mycobacterium xenopi 4042]EUA33821.1 hypothetical protein I552_4602 [Mycobacterium xenopi 3993]
MRMSAQILPGLNEINAGVYNRLPEFSLAGLLYIVGRSRGRSA